MKNHLFLVWENFCVKLLIACLPLAQPNPQWTSQKGRWIVFLRIRVRHDVAKCKIWRWIQMTAALVNPKTTGTTVTGSRENVSWLTSLPFYFLFSTNRRISKITSKNVLTVGLFFYQNKRTPVISKRQLTHFYGYRNESVSGYKHLP